MTRSQEPVGPPLLLETKLFVPRPPRGLVPRPRLSERLDSATSAKLVLVSAPAGFGKTALLAEWLASSAGMQSSDWSAAWLSLDREDNQPAVFWTYIIAALQTVSPEVGAHALSVLQAPQAPATQTVLTSLLNDLGSVPSDVVLILDDYHVLDSLDVQEGMAFLLDHLPPRVHVVIASRADPALPLSRLRARGELLEIRASELRFTVAEAGGYLNGAMDLVLTDQDVAALEGRTEGWIAALQLAALSMQGRNDNAEFIAAFAGDDRYIVDYLVEEVLQRQPEQVQDFLLQTSILNRLNGSLCDAVTGQDGGRAMLEALDRGNLFVVPLDDRRQWYRYHHLFADVLRARLLDEQAGQLRRLHRRASDWYERSGDRPEAIRHAMRGHDFERAASLVELALPEMRQHRLDATMHRWLQDLPDDQIRVRPVLSNGYAGAILTRSELAGVEERLRDAERWLELTDDAARAQGPRPPGMVVADEVAFRGLPGAVAVHRAGQARLLGDVAGTAAHARRALELLAEDDLVGRGAATALLGLAYWTSGDLETAYRWYADGMASLDKAGYLSDVVGGSVGRADLRIAQGRLGDAMRIYERGLEMATSQPGVVLRGAADMHVGISEILRERNDLDGARQCLRGSSDLGESADFPQNPHRWRVAMAGIRAAEGDYAGALDLLDEAEQCYVSDFSPEVRPIAAAKARVRIAQGKWSDVLGWAAERGLSADDELSYLHEFEHVTLVRALLAGHGSEREDNHLDQAEELLERLLGAAERGGRIRSVIEILVLQAVASQARADTAAALTKLERALTLAEPEGYVRIFVDEGPVMAGLLEAASQQALAPGYVRRLLSAFGESESTTTARPESALIEPLSVREREVLRLLGTELGGPEIARELVVSLNTVRSHTKSIYTKLGVTNRRAAVRRAQELKLTGPVSPGGWQQHR